jgi:prepilin-type N-terminal cleavage/methylation domain-containing protein
MKNKKGFTLIELIIVIAVIAILAGAIFMAIDPARRLHESRNARRSSDIATILDAIKTYQADTEGELFGPVAAMDNDHIYQIGEDPSGCTIDCLTGESQDSCVDLSGIGSSYLSKVPFDPKEGDSATTGYGILKDANGAITLIACYAEREGPGGSGTIPDLRVTR